MRQLRVLTWNPGGEFGNRGVELANAVNTLNQDYKSNPPVQIVVVQEAKASPGGGIEHALDFIPPFDPEFCNPHGFALEHDQVGQIKRISKTKAYRLAWLKSHPVKKWNLSLPGGAGSLSPDPTLVNLSLADAGVRSFCNVFLNKQAYDTVTSTAANIRWPIYKKFKYSSAAIHFFSWHAPLKSNWLPAEAVYPFTPPGDPGFVLSFQLLMSSAFYSDIIRDLGQNDLVVIAGDFNVHRSALKSLNLFPQFEGASDNLSHIIAYSKNKIQIDQGMGLITPYKPHCIVSARIRW